MIKAMAKHTVKNIWLYSVIFIISSFLSNRWKKSTEITWNRGRRSKHCLIIKQQVKSSQDIWVDVRPFQHVSHNSFCIFISLHSSLSLSSLHLSCRMAPPTVCDIMQVCWHQVRSHPALRSDHKTNKLFPYMLSTLPSSSSQTISSGSRLEDCGGRGSWCLVECFGGLEFGINHQQCQQQSAPTPSHVLRHPSGWEPHM